MSDFLGEILPLILLTAGVYLVKMGAFSAAVILLKKFWDFLRGKRIP